MYKERALVDAINRGEPVSKLDAILASGNVDINYHDRDQKYNNAFSAALNHERYDVMKWLVHNGFRFNTCVFTTCYMYFSCFTTRVLKLLHLEMNVSVKCSDDAILIKFMMTKEFIFLKFLVDYDIHNRAVMYRFSKIRTDIRDYIESINLKQVAVTCIIKNRLDISALPGELQKVICLEIQGNHPGYGRYCDLSR